MTLTWLLAAAGPAAPVIPKAVATASATLSPQVLKQLQQQLSNVRPHQASWIGDHAPWLAHTFGGIFALSAVALVLLLAVQTTKQEGLSGTIGGRVEAAYRPRLGFDQQLARLTGFVAITFVVFATLVSLTGI